MNSVGLAKRLLRAGLLALMCDAVVGCGGSVALVGTGASSSSGAAGSDVRAGGDGIGGNGQGAGSSAIAGSDAGGTGSLGGAGMSGAEAGGVANDHCKAIQAAAQQAVDASCKLDSDCKHPPHTLGDCVECGVVTNTATEQSSLDAARRVCKQFYADACQEPWHSCPASQPACIAGVCR